MRDHTYDDLLREFNTNPPSDDLEANHFQEKTGIELPSDYIEFLKYANGGEGFIGENSYCMLWKLGELTELNSAYEAKEYAPGLLLFGSNGGGEAYAFDTEASPWRIVQVPFVGMSRDLIEVLAPNFNDFLKYLYDAE